MAWFYLILAGLSEIVWAFGLKESHGFTMLGWSLLTVAFLIVSFWLFSIAMRHIPIGTAYAIFTGIGAAGTAIVGMVFLSEGVSFWKIVSLIVLLVGIIGLKLVDGSEPEKDGR
ncbi:multidrug efflux SMR transporter [Listeria sp. FSL L7-1485]|uniref:Multidrug efflux SMR transporter n=1 Tax=Listeria immobilis TaxID=2713502 RepID=A0A7X1C929_9LIST|nr:multidrug efflux SMR transporter [Listeria immobilis]MBC1484045.1 multidrug efflux SMR transporter [Listeria immobilis]MBC1488866.1 multidrug efflux SMR transporter [Listeria immobilis]MBC1505760.1 multidrug efflux SMR transporter [Listeria immobilis]MBC1508449.1 multidrug efflux SMR transporter [Listeria immobilis]MBC1514854.1 multidrug efflux SMR transporter [Listeria immobilis]